MNSIERVEATYKHIATDRIPTTFKNDAPVVTEDLIELLGVSTRDEVLLRLGIDVRVEMVPYIGPELVQAGMEGHNMSRWGTILGTYAAGFPRPLAHVETLADLKAWKRPDPDWFDYEALAANCARWTDHAVYISN